MAVRDENFQFESQYPADSWENEIGKILSWVEKGHSGQMLGLPGVGKYLVFGLLAYNKNVRVKHLGEKQKKYQFVYIDFSEVRNRQLQDVMKMLFLALADSLRDRQYDTEYQAVNKLLRNALTFNDELVLTEELKHAIEYLAYERKMKVIFLFDQFERYIPHVESMFFSNLRLLRNRAKYQFSVIFSSNKPLEQLLEPGILEDFSDLMVDNTLYLPLYDRPSVDFRLDHLEKLTGKKLPGKIVESFVGLTGGHGKLMRMASESYLFRKEQINDVTTFLLSQKIVLSALDEIWLSLSPSEQQYLFEPDAETVTKPKAKEYLQSVHLLKDETIEIPLFEEYIQRVLSKAQSASEKIVYDEVTNSIKKGELVLSDDLTSSEFLLLRYLVLNQEKIIERDELIDIVWGDNRSTAGVTDQALDQLIFRVRRKIEENPTTPTHLLTVKGRGFRFIA